MSISKRIPAAQAQLTHSRKILDSVAGRTVLLDAAGIAPPKSAATGDGGAQSARVQRHGGK